MQIPSNEKDNGPGKTSSDKYGIYLAELLAKKDAIDPLNITCCCQAYWFPPISEDTTYVTKHGDISVVPN